MPYPDFAPGVVARPYASQHCLSHQVERTSAGMAEPAAEAALGWPQEVFDEFDSNLPLQHQFYTRILDAQAAAEADKLHPSQLPLNAGLAAPAARVVQRAQGTSQRLPDLAEECLAPMLGQRGSVAVVEPRGQQADGRRARKRQRGQAAAAGSTFRGPSYSGRFVGSGAAPSPQLWEANSCSSSNRPILAGRRYNIHPSGPGEVPLIAKRETTLTRTIDALTQQASIGAAASARLACRSVGCLAAVRTYPCVF